MLDLVRKEQAYRTDIRPHINQSASRKMLSQEKDIPAIRNAEVKNSSRHLAIRIGKKVHPIEKRHSDRFMDDTFPHLPPEKHRQPLYPLMTVELLVPDMADRESQLSNGFTPDAHFSSHRFTGAPSLVLSSLAVAAHANPSNEVTTNWSVADPQPEPSRSQRSSAKPPGSDRGTNLQPAEESRFSSIGGPRRKMVDLLANFDISAKVTATFIFSQ
jgi:hypothetical protein